MLLAVEGGGFFSSSASGYSKGLTLLLLGQSSEERPMRVSPWNQFHLLEQNDSDLQLASKKNRRSRGCASFICFRRTSSGPDGPSPPKVGPVRQPNELQDPSSASDQGKLCVIDGNDENGQKVYLKSSLKKPADCSVVIGTGDDEHGTLNEKGHDDAAGCAEKRKVQWTDACGRELVEIKEFEASELGASDEEFDGDRDRGCSCLIQ